MKLKTLKLRMFTLRGARRREALKGVKLRAKYDFASPWVHPLSAGVKFYRVGKDVVVLTDGGYGYIPFAISDLVTLVKDLGTLEIVNEVRLP